MKPRWWGEGVGSKKCTCMGLMARSLFLEWVILLAAARCWRRAARRSLSWPSLRPPPPPPPPPSALLVRPAGGCFRRPGAAARVEARRGAVRTCAPPAGTRTRSIKHTIVRVRRKVSTPTRETVGCLGGSNTTRWYLGLKRCHVAVGANQAPGGGHGHIMAAGAGLGQRGEARSSNSSPVRVKLVGREQQVLDGADLGTFKSSHVSPPTCTLHAQRPSRGLNFKHKPRCPTLAAGTYRQGSAQGHANTFSQCVTGVVGRSCDEIRCHV